MPAFLALVPVRYWLYGAAALAVVVGALSMRQHYINYGRDITLEAVKKQDGRAVDAARTVQKTVDQCYDSGGVWSTITGECAQ